MSMTGLYEAFLSSIPDNSVEQMPLIVTKYFQYSSSVAYQKKGLLYGNIIDQQGQGAGGLPKV